MRAQGKVLVGHMAVAGLGQRKVLAVSEHTQSVRVLQMGLLDLAKELELVEVLEMVWVLDRV